MLRLVLDYVHQMAWNGQLIIRYNVNLTLVTTWNYTVIRRNLHVGDVSGLHLARAWLLSFYSPKRDHYISDNQIFGYTLDILSRQLGHVPKRKLRVTPRFGQRYYGKDDFWVICPLPVRMTGSTEDQQKSLMTDIQLRLNSLLHTSWN